MERRQAIKALLASIGVAASSQTLLSIAQASQQNPHKNQLWFREDQRELIKRFSEVILPETSIPGAVTLKLHYFVDTMVKETFDRQKQRLFVNGLTLFQKTLPTSNVENKAKQLYVNYLSHFYSLPLTQQEEYQDFDTLPLENIPKNKKAHYYQYAFLTTLKTVLMIGYFTHEKIAPILRDPRDYPTIYQPG
ncbi:gluconate 2-dehydrogenase subunit 3 family protein [Thalassotalea sp. 1_MG-2023]|uniref:gluconate 2-dehydrogenase subunit 3 family protein n=1 Tax=Thalassotalea sp. 1_MG-2023 TaxID=3062680 RepID=UPI0026E2FB53|nr:gluconate 2-dehydrogenase subunit 3 family protein [Thalassotalea sp. 1_MG-2023]MDO6428668.1 gluconate 2-dehydrogenase subunit 3 family protein [Thalassotalea sp. 1_MG-2023]